MENTWRFRSHDWRIRICTWIRCYRPKTYVLFLIPWRLEAKIPISLLILPSLVSCCLAIEPVLGCTADLGKRKEFTQLSSLSFAQPCTHVHDILFQLNHRARTSWGFPASGGIENWRRQASKGRSVWCRSARRGTGNWRGYRLVHRKKPPSITNTCPISCLGCNSIDI